MTQCLRPKYEVLLHAIIGGLFGEQLMPPGSVLDVGANDGEMAAYYACLDSSRVVHALEPSLHMYHALHQASKGGARNVATLRAGVTSKDHALYGTGIVGMTPAQRIARGILVVNSRRSEPDFPLYRVDSLFATDKSALFAGETIGFWHLDVEWHELEALRGAVATIQRDQPIFAAEVHVHWNRTYTHELISFIQDTLGYVIYLVDEICGVRIDCRNLLCVPALRAGSLVKASRTLQAALGSGTMRRISADTIFVHTPRSVQQLFERRKCSGRDLNDVHVRRDRRPGLADPMEVTPEQIKAETKEYEANCTRLADADPGGEDSIFWITRPLWPSRRPLPRCAIVGGGAGLLGRGLGPRIDAHNLVVRVNRMLGNQPEHDVGERTDVYFSKPCRVVSRGGTNAPQLEVIRSGFPPQRCSTNAFGTGKECPFRAFIMRGGNVCKNRIEALRSVRNHSDIALGMESPAVYDKTLQMLGLSQNSSMDATTGLHAVITFRPLCSSISLFGFRGNSTFDGHHLVNHAIDQEHALLREMEEEIVNQDGTWLASVNVIA